jgi:hypothetical protein
MTFNKFSNLLKNLDIIGPSFQLNTYAESKFRTYIGGLLTILCFLSISSLSLYFIYNTFARTKPSVLNNRVFDNNPSFDYAKFPVMMGVAGTDTLFHNDTDSIYNIRAAYHYFGEGLQSMKFIELNMTKCNPELFGSNKAEFLDVMYFPFLYCLDITSSYFNSNKTIIKGQVGSLEENGFIGFYINKCKNSTTSKKCKSEDEIDSRLGNVYLGLFFVDFYIDSNNYETPGKPFLNMMAFSIHPSIYKGFIVMAENIEFTTDQGLLLNNEHTQKYYTFLNTYESADLRNGATFPGNFASIYLSGVKVKETYYRSYPKLQDLFATIGGVFKAIIILTSFLQNYFIRKNYLQTLYNDLMVDNPKILKLKKEIKLKFKSQCHQKIQLEEEKKEKDDEKQQGSCSLRKEYSQAINASQLSGFSSM